MKNGLGSLAALLFLIIAVLGCQKWVKVDNANDRPDNDVQKPRADMSRSFTLAGKEWSTYELDKTDIKLELPGSPSDKTPQLPPAFNEVFSAMNIHSYDDADFTIGATELVPAGKQKWTIKQLADTSMTATKRQQPDLTYTLEIKSESNAKYNGSFTKSGKRFDLSGCCVYKKTDPARVWAVMALYASDNADAKQAAQRAIDSVVFEGSSEECE